MISRYVAWLQTKGVLLFESNGTYWQLYNRALIPASPAPSFVELSSLDAEALLTKSGAWFLRYSSNPSDSETNWWYIVHDLSPAHKYSSNTRSKINRGGRKCQVKAVGAGWIAEHGYETYLAAHERYKNATPLPKPIFCRNVLGNADGPIEYWGVFVNGSLAGYCQCIIENHNVDTSVTRFDPTYLKFYTSYALISFLVEHYVIQREMSLSNGDRSILHHTNFQEFLLQLGFRKKYCRLNIVYRQPMKAAVETLFPLRRIIARLPNQSTVYKVKALLLQEEIRRSCQ